MTTRKISVALFALAGLVGTDALADTGVSNVTKILGSSKLDLAPVTNSSPARLRRTRNEQPGAEMATVAMFGDNVHGIYFERRSGAINGQLPTDNVQGAMVYFKLVQDATTGVVSAAVDPTVPAKFITNNRGSEQRNFNVPVAHTINGGTAIAITYSYRPNNRTYRYMQVYNMAGQQIMPQTEIYRKTNDDCQMMQDGSGVVHTFDAATLTSHVHAWAGCNGNGADNGWYHGYDIVTDSATAPTTAKFVDTFDVALCQREERSRGHCTTGTDPNTAICTWTEGNNQPQRDGVWMAAVDVTPGKYKGTDQQKAILWKQMIGGKVDATADGTPRTYAQRAMSERVSLPDASGNLAATDLLIYRYGDAKGNNTDNRKGGTYYRNNVAVIKADKSGMTYVVPMHDMQKDLVGMDGTHMGVGFGVFGTTDKPVPGMILMTGSHNGGGTAAQMTAVGLDTTAGTMSKVATTTVAPYDRHMYSNYLGQNPGNQGRNFSHTLTIKNPFVGQAGNKDAFLMVMGTTGKDTTEVAHSNPDGTINDTCFAADDTAKTTPVPCARLKLSSYITVLPIAQQGCGAGNGTGGGGGGGGGGTGTGGGCGTGGGSGSGSGSSTGTGSGSGSGSGSDTGTGSDTSSDPGTTLGGCSATGSGGALTFLLIGLAGFIRRRR
jgi:uncharacterized protein (TIGR03382 family)